MQLPPKFINFDFHFQTIFGGITLALCFVFYGLILLPFFGAWQVISALVLVLGYGDKKRIPYLVTVLGWGLMTTIMINSDFFREALVFLFLILIPAGIGVWYFTITRRDYLALKTPEPNPDILDTEI